MMSKMSCGTVVLAAVLIFLAALAADVVAWLAWVHLP